MSDTGHGGDGHKTTAAVGGPGGGYDTSRPVRSFLEVVRAVLVTPAPFFRSLAVRGVRGELSAPAAAGVAAPGRSWRERARGLKAALIFAVVCGLISQPLGLLTEPVNPATPAGSDPLSRALALGGDQPVVLVALSFVVFFVFVPLAAVIGVYAGAAFQHLFVYLFLRERRSPDGYWATVPVIAYGASAISLLTWIPVLGALAGIYGLYLTTVGLREMHRTTTLRAFLAALIPALLGLTSTLLPFFRVL